MNQKQLDNAIERLTTPLTPQEELDLQDAKRIRDMPAEALAVKLAAHHVEFFKQLPDAWFPAVLESVVDFRSRFPCARAEHPSAVLEAATRREPGPGLQPGDKTRAGLEPIEKLAIAHLKHYSDAEFAVFVERAQAARKARTA
jgi:hypothetical protein